MHVDIDDELRPSRRPLVKTPVSFVARYTGKAFDRLSACRDQVLFVSSSVPRKWKAPSLSVVIRTVRAGLRLGCNLDLRSLPSSWAETNTGRLGASPLFPQDSARRLTEIARSLALQGDPH